MGNSPSYQEVCSLWTYLTHAPPSGSLERHSSTPKCLWLPHRPSGRARGQHGGWDKIGRTKDRQKQLRTSTLAGIPFIHGVISVTAGIRAPVREIPAFAGMTPWLGQVAWSFYDRPLSLDILASHTHHTTHSRILSAELAILTPIIRCDDLFWQFLSTDYQRPRQMRRENVWRRGLFGRIRG